MKVVVDANRVFSFVLRDGATRKIFISTSVELFAPVFLRDEIHRNLPELADRSGLAKTRLAELVDTVFAQIAWVRSDALNAHIAQAEKALAHRDPTDVPYLACALAIGAEAIWSHDPDFDAQRIVRRIQNNDLR